MRWSHGITMTGQIHAFAQLQTAARERAPRIALILGSGLGDLADRLADVVELPFGRVPGLSESSVPGHRGAVLLGEWNGVPLLVFAGRLHYYEGHPWRTVVQPIRIAHELGASILITTNAAGAIRDDLRPGDLMAIHAHLDCTREYWWKAACGVADAVEFATPQAAYSERLLNLLSLPRGVYAQVTGPSYETPAEIRALRTCGVDAVGMSTAREIQTGFDLGMECAAISCITNKAAGLGSGAISHEEVLQAGSSVRERILGLLDTFIARAN